MNPFKDLKNYYRFAGALRNFFRRPLSLQEARAIIELRLQGREPNFLQLVEQ